MHLILKNDVVAFTPEALEKLPWIRQITNTIKRNHFEVLSLGRSLSGNALHDIEINLPTTPGNHPCVRHWFCGSHFDIVLASPLMPD